MAERINVVKSVAETVDDVIDSVVGGRPLTRLISILEAIGPAKVARKLGLPAPGDLPDKIVQEIETAVKTGTPPKLPTPEEVLRKLRVG